MTARVALALVLLATPAAAQQPTIDVPFTDIGLSGTIFAARPVELDGQPGSEWVFQRSFLSAEWWVLYPTAKRSGQNGERATPGVCVAGPFVFASNSDSLADVDGDGRAERVRFDFTTQRVLVWPLPTGRCFED